MADAEDDGYTLGCCSADNQRAYQKIYADSELDESATIR